MQPAHTLAESASRLQQDALEPTSRFYADLRAARGSKALTKLEVYLRNAAKTPKAYAKAAFVGNRGSGKSTFLLHLESELQRERIFTPLHIYLDPSLESDCTYSDLILWMVDAIANEFTAREHPVDAAELSKVISWFNETTIERSSELKKEVGLATEMTASAETGIPFMASIKFLARIKSMMKGSQTSRKTIRESLQNYANELRDRVNGFLEHAREVLEKAGKPPRLLIVQDNLDRLRGENARQLFEVGGELLTELNADFIYTAPLALNLTPYDLRRAFSHIFTMHNVKVHLRDGSEYSAGIAGLLDLIGKRLVIDFVFENESVAHYLAAKSGGSIGDLLRLLEDAQLDAQVDGKDRIDQASAVTAVHNLSLTFVRNLLPGSAYYPALAGIHRTHCEPDLPAGEITREGVINARTTFSELINMGVVLEYNGDDSWYDVHPALCENQRFQDACQLPLP